ncbi:MAG: glycosyltransferase [Candidatus Sericytochromatia bacterium]|nr:glycosyltransferase [Candidatus Tanganyikabacteria bacterium]
MRLAGRDIVCLSVMDWDHPFPTSRHALMARLAMCNRVLFVDAFESPWTVLRHLGDPRLRGRLARWLGLAPDPRREGLNLWIHTPPPCLPMGGLPDGPLFEWAYARNQRRVRRDLRLVAGRLGLREPILWLSFGTLPSEGAIGATSEALVVYHCTDDVAAMPGVAPAAARIERRLIARADLVFCSSAELAASRGGIYVPNGVDYERFAEAQSSGLPVPRALADLPRPVLGYVGQIDERVDFDLLEQVGALVPGWSLILLGAVAPRVRGRVDRLRARWPECRAPGLVPQADLPRWLKGMDVAILPWRLTARTRAIYPHELHEAFAAGLPVVATPFADLPDAREATYWAGDAETFVAAVVRAFTEGLGQAARARRQSLARAASWDVRLAEMESYILDRLARGSSHARPRS